VDADLHPTAGDGKGIDGMNAPRPTCLLAALTVLIVPDRIACQTVEARRSIRVVMDNAYAPYVFRSSDGTPRGILIDQWRAWEKVTGIKVTIQSFDWSEALRRMRAGEFDVIDCIVETPDRHPYYEFTPGYAAVEAAIFFRSDIAGITDIASLRGFPVGVKVGDQHVDRLREQGVTAVIPFPNNDALIRAAKQQKISVFLSDFPSAVYQLARLGIDDKFRHSAPIFRDSLRRAVRRGDTATLRVVTQGFAAIDPKELKRINDRWFGSAISDSGRYTTYARYGAVVAIVAIVVIAGLIRWNHSLRTGILQRTAALSESEQRFRQIAENVREVFWAREVADGRVSYVSPMYETVFGRSRESLYQEPRSFLDAVHVDDHARVEASLARQGAGEPTDEMYRVVRPDGSVRWVRSRTFPVRDNGGRAYRIVGLVEDLTEIRHTEEQLRQAQKMEALGLLAGGIAHDLNNVLTAVLGFSALWLAELPDDDPARADVLEIQRAGERAAALTRQLLAFSRKQVAQPKLVDVNTLVRSMQILLRRLIVESVDIRLELSPSGTLVLIDPTQLEQVLVNLAINAADAMPRGGRLTIETRAVTVADHPKDLPVPPGKYVMLAVTDTGIGMDDATRQRIFEPFFTTKEVGKGTGLGLATVYGIVRQNGGDIVVQSQPGRGSRFEIILPRVAGTEAAAVSPAPEAARRKGSETVLLVEDDDAVRRLARVTLEHDGYRVIEASNPREALQRAEAFDGAIHILVSDVVMPESHGPPLFDRLASTRSALRVIYMSGYADDEIVRYGILVEGAPFLQKPFTPEALSQKVREVLDAR
jgi:PAS domain S-box-containing protein